MIRRKLSEKYDRGFSGKNMNSIRSVFSIILITGIIIVLLGELTFFYFKSNRNHCLVSYSIIKTKNKITYLDEVLATSIFMASETGDNKWLKRHMSARQSLDSILFMVETGKKLGKFKQSLEFIKENHIRNSQIEDRAIQKINEGTLREAQKILNNYNYDRLVPGYSSIATTYSDSELLENHIEKLRGSILILHEVLTMSEKLYSISGDEKWKLRYVRHERLYKTVLESAITFIEEKTDTSIQSIDSVNNSFITLEKASLQYLKNGDIQNSNKLLLSKEYNLLKQLDKSHLNALNSVLYKYVNDKIKKSLKRIRLFGVVILVLIIALIILWLILSKPLKTFQSKLLQVNQQLEDEIKIKESNLRKFEFEKNNLSYIINILPDLLFIKDENSVYIECNDTFLKYLDLTREDVIGKTDFDIFPDELAKVYRTDDRIVIAKGEQKYTEQSYHNSVFISTIKVPYQYLDNNTTKTGVLGISRDITDIKKTEQLLKESERKFRSIFENSPVGIAIINKKGNPELVNPKMTEILGFTKDEMKKKSFRDFNHPEDLERTNKLFQELISGQRNAFTIDKKYIPKSGVVRYGNITVSSVRNEEGILLYNIAMLTDITDRKIKENEILEKDAILNQLIKHMPFAIAMLNRNMEYIHVNDEWFNTYNIPKQNLVGKNHYEIFPETSEDWKKIHQSCLRGGFSKSDGEPFSRTEGAVDWVRWDIRPWKKADDKIGGLIMYTEVITSQKQMELDLVAAKDLAEKANLSKSRFFANMSHEMRTPLNAILGFSQLLYNQLNDKELKGYSKSVLTSGKGLLTLINDILDLSKIEEGKLELKNEYVNPVNLFKELHDIFSLLAKNKGLELIFEIDKSIPHAIYIDETRLRQILINLIGNALKFTEEGFVRIKVKSKASTNRQTQLINLFITVEDTGIGINKNDLESIFGLFTQVHSTKVKQREGSGLGLNITKQLVAMMNGEIHVESTLQEGTRFTIDIFEAPYLNEYQINDKVFELKYKNIEFESKKVLVVDDDKDNRMYLLQALKGKGLDLIQAENAEQAISVLNKERIDIVIIDLKIPQKAGYQFLTYIRENSKFSNIIVIASSASSLETDFDTYEHQFNGFLMKPINLNDLYMELTKFLPHRNISEELTEEFKTKGVSETITNKSELINQLDGSLRKEWEQFKEQRPLKEIKQFSEKLSELGKKHNAELIQDYANRIREAVDFFDIEQLLIQLEDYENILQTLREK